MRRDAGAARPAALGVAAFVIAVTAVTVGAALLFVSGLIAGPVTRYIDPNAPQSPDFTSLPAAAQQILTDASGWYTAGLAVFGILAIWAGIQGVTAYVQRRGRRWALLAIAVAVIGYLIVTSAQQYGTTFTSVPYDGPATPTATPTATP